MKHGHHVRNVRGFDPAHYGSLAAWLDPTTFTVDGSNNVQTWGDKSGNGHAPTQGTAGKRPSYQATGGPTGGPCVLGVIANATRLVASWTLPQPVHLFIVEKQGPGLADNACICDGGGGAVNSMRVFYTAAGTRWNLQAGATLAGPAVSAGWHVREAVFNGVSSNQYQDGVAGTAGNAGATAAGGICLLSAGDDRFYADNSIAEVLVFSAVVTDRATIAKWLGNKYNISVS